MFSLFTREGKVIWQDIIFGVRMLLRQAGFTVIALLTLAIGIRENTAIFSVINITRIGVLILTQGVKLTLIGIGLGLLAAFALTRWMESLLFGVPTTDALTFGGIAIVLLLGALFACWLPARRAMKLDPMTAMKME